MLKLALHLAHAFAHLRTVVTRHSVNAGIVRQCVQRSTRFAPYVVRLTKTALWTLRVVVAHSLHLRDLFEELVEVLVGQVVQRWVQSKSSERGLSFREGPVHVDSVNTRSSRGAGTCRFDLSRSEVSSSDGDTHLGLGPSTVSLLPHLFGVVEAEHMVLT